MAIEMKGGKKRRALRPVGIREAARLTGCSPSHAWYIRHSQRTSARFERKMRELGLTFEEEDVSRRVAESQRVAAAPSRPVARPRTKKEGK